MEEQKPKAIFYEYVCANCEQTFVLMLTSQDLAPVCPHCGSQKLFRRATPAEEKRFGLSDDH